MRWESGQVVGGGRYKLLRLLGQGGQGDAWEARRLVDGGLAKTVVLKLVRIQELFGAMAQEFLWEARMATMLEHPNILRVFTVVEEDDIAFAAMEPAVGRTLREWLVRYQQLHHKPLPWPMVAHVMMQVCEGLEYAHHLQTLEGQPLQLVHRDLHPQNILITRQGHAKILDFGVLKTLSQRDDTENGTLKKISPFFSPEQVLAKPVDKLSDLFSLGAISYEMCSGKRAFNGTNPLEVVRKIVACQPEPLSEVAPFLPEELHEAIECLMQANPDLRPASAEEVRATMDGLLQHTPFSMGDLKALFQELFGEGDDPSFATRGAIA